MKVKGAVLNSRIAFIKKNFGEEGFKKVLEFLSKEDREIISGLIPSMSWFPFEVGMRLDEAIFKVLGGSNPKIFEELGAISARENLSKAHKHFLEVGNPLKFLEKAPLIYKFYYDTGYRTFEKINDNEVVLTTYESESFSSADCLTVIGWYKEALKMCGAKLVKIVEEECRAKGGKFCKYRIKFKI